MYKLKNELKSGGLHVEVESEEEEEPKTVVQGKDNHSIQYYSQNPFLFQYHLYILALLYFICLIGS